MHRISEEAIDMIAEAARVSPHAARAYALIEEDAARRSGYDRLPSLKARQELIAGRMEGVPL